MAAKPTDQEPPPDLQQLKYKTWALKVSIHCEGCKRKVKKILQGIEGVYKTDIDSQQHKVTVTGNVESDTLLKQLGRYGKLAELWPENPETKTKKKKKKKKKNKSSNGNGSQTQTGQEPSEDEDENDEDHPLPQEGKDEIDSDEDDEDEGEEAAGGNGTAPPAAASSKKKKKKKKKKAQTGENPLNPDSTGHGPPEPQQFYPYGQGVPMYYHQPPALPPPPPAAAYGLSYSTVNPRVSESYYARDPMHDHHYYASGYNNNYRYVRAGNGDEVYNLYDDDEGGCSVM